MAVTEVVLFYGMFELDVCGVHSVCSIYEAFGLIVFVAFRVFVAYMGHWGGTVVAFTVLAVFMLNVCGVHSVCSISEAFRLVFLFSFFLFFFCGVARHSVQRLWYIGVGPLWHSQRL